MFGGMDALFHAAAFSPDPLVRDIVAEIDDRDLAEIAHGIYDTYFDPDLTRSFQEPRATEHITAERASDVLHFAVRCTYWAKYAQVCGDYSRPPWERGA